MIEVGRNNIVVRNVNISSKEYRNCAYKYSLYDKVQHKYTFSAYSIYNNDLYFPSSVTIEAIEQLFPGEEVSINYNTTAKAKSIKYNMKHQPRNELQEKSIEFLMKMPKDSKWHQRFLSLETGSGKTYIVINCIPKLKKRPMIVVDTAELALQWKREFLNHTDLKDTDIVILSGQEIVDKESKKSTGKVYIAMHRTLGNMLKTDINSVNVLMNKLGIGLRVFDESHVDFGNICRINSFSNVEYTIYLTATPSRSAYNDDSLYGRVFRSIPYFNGKELSGEKYHDVIIVHMNTHPGFDEQLAVRTKYGFNQARWAEYVSKDAYEELLETLQKIIAKFKLNILDKKVAIMLPTIELIKKLKKDLEDMYPGIDIGTFIGEIPKEKRSEELKKPVILTNDKIFDKGIDLGDLEILINFVQISSRTKIEQIIGRLRYKEGKSSILIDVTDDGFKKCEDYLKIRKRFYKVKAKQIFELK